MSMISATLAQQHQYYRPQAVQQQVQQQQQPVYRDQPQQPLPVILSHKQALGQDGSFRYQFAADNGLQQGESIAPDGTRTGQYSYVDPDGQKIMIKYVAGKDGFRVLEGDHLPRAPQAPQVPAPAAQPQAYQQAQPQQQLYQQPQYQYQQPQQQYQQPQQQYQQPQQQYQQQQPRYYQGQQKVDDGSYRSEDHDEGQYDPRVYEVEENNNNNNNQYQTQSFRNERGPHKFGPGYAFEING